MRSRVSCNVLTVLFCAVAATCVGTTNNKSAPPNFVLLLLDDHGYGDVGVYNNATQETPNMDKFAATGIRFTDFHSAASLCTPSRAAMLTGRLGLRTGVTTNFGPTSLGGLPPEEYTIAELLPKAYHNHMIGKWHLGHQAPFHPSYRGFDSVFGLPYSGDMGCLDITPQSCKPLDIKNRSIGTPSCPALCNANGVEVGVPLYDVGTINCTSTIHNGTATTTTVASTTCNDLIAEQPVDEFTLNQRYAQRARDIIAKEASSPSPFFLYIGFAHTHSPMAYNDEKWGNASKNRSGWNRHYGNTLAEVDDAVGQVIAALEKHGLTNNTLVLLTSDNGPADVDRMDCDFIGSPGPFQGKWQKSPNGGGGGGVMKGTLWEGGHRVISVASWPGTIKGGRISNELTSALDILPTFMSLSNESLPADRTLDGMDLSALLKNENVTMSQLVSRHGGRNAIEFEQDNHDASGDWQRVLFHPSIMTNSSGHLNAMRVGRYKLVFETGGTHGCNKTNVGPKRQFHDPPLVFDVVSDPAESTPISISPNLMLRAVEARDAKLHDIKVTLSHKANMAVGTRADSPCCNQNSSVCRCPWQETFDATSERVTSVEDF